MHPFLFLRAAFPSRPSSDLHATSSKDSKPICSFEHRLKNESKSKRYWKWGGGFVGDCSSKGKQIVWIVVNSRLSLSLRNELAAY